MLFTLFIRKPFGLKNKYLKQWDLKLQLWAEHIIVLQSNVFDPLDTKIMVYAKFEENLKFSNKNLQTWMWYLPHLFFIE